MPPTAGAVATVPTAGPGRRTAPSPRPEVSPPAGGAGSLTGTEAGTRLAAGRLWAATRMPYFATALFALRPVAAPGLATFAVDTGWRLYVDPATAGDWTIEEIGAVLIHEVLHLLRDHASRGQDQGVNDRTAAAWNTACDAEINDDLVEAALPLPGEPILPSTLGRRPGQLAETYYRSRRRARGPDCGSGVHGRPRPHEAEALAGDPDAGLDGIDPLEAAGIRRQAAAAVLAAAGKSPGSVPAGLQRWASIELEPVVDWRRELAACVRRATYETAGRVDYSPGRRNRRAAAVSPVILPGLVRPVPSVAVVIDTSGSVDEEELSAAVAEVGGITAAIGARQHRVTVFAVDEEVQAVSRAAGGRDIQLAGGGGTDMGKGLAAAAALRPRPHVVVVLTDGWTPWPARPPAGATVVVGLIGAEATAPDTLPAWAHAVRIRAGSR
jgi:predicted metal-dependent peptidase